MVGAFSFLQPYWHIQPPLQPPPKIRSPISAIFHLPIPPLVVHKIILTISTNILFFYTLEILHLPIFAYSCLYSTYQNYLSCLGQLAPSIRRLPNKENREKDITHNYYTLLFSQVRESTCIFRSFDL